MAWIARDMDGTLCIFSSEPERNDDLWMPKCDTYENRMGMVELPSYADVELIGRHITWENSPVEIKAVPNKEKGIDWEQRRYEIAKDILAAYMSNSDKLMHQGTPTDIVKDAIEMADALIEGLKK